MGFTPSKGLLFVSGAVIAGLGAAYVLGAFDKPEPSPAAVSGAPDAAAPATPSAKPDDARAAADTKEARLEEAASADDAKASDALSPAKEVLPPSFDIVRVEPNGSMVIAGRAAPDAQVEIINGSSVLAIATTGASGDFAAVLDEPLEPGDYQIVLRATTGDNVVATSLETAIVTVPDDETGQVLALVDKPGAPSRLITVPEAKAPQAETAQASAPAAAPGQGEGEQVAASDAGAPVVNAPAGQDTTQPAAETQATGEEPVETASAQDAQPTATGEAPAQTPKAQSATSPFIEAVEIDGGEVFVAGAARAGSTLRVYANQILLGETVATPNGRFLIEATRELPVGDYIVRADMLSDDGRTVIGRAAVPFSRSEGEQIAAVAKPEGQAPTLNDASNGKDARLPEGSGQAADGTGESTPQGQQAVASAGDSASENGATAPKLAPVDGSVIIRRGDTLWHISRRVYGQGIRYTTLYLANQDQIEDPDRIWPGQVFAVPETTQEGEPADMKAIEERMVTPENPG